MIARVVIIVAILIASPLRAEVLQLESHPVVIYYEHDERRVAKRVFEICEDDIPRPFSPYGVTKLAAEHLVRL